jgi:hypothetical protein
MPSQTSLKERKPTQGTAEELARKDFLAELEAKERKHFQLDKIEEFERALHELCVLYSQLVELCVLYFKLICRVSRCAASCLCLLTCFVPSRASVLV